jgi:dihydrolipoamide dehydrogenase
MAAMATKVLVVGGGPGGYVAAIRCGQLGLETTLVEAGRLGGTCLTRGCIPSKALIPAAGQFDAMTRAAASPHLGISLARAPTIDLAGTVAWKDGIVDTLCDGVGGLLRRAKVRCVTGWARFSDAKTCRVGTEDGEVAITAEHVILANGSVPVELPALPFGGIVISSDAALSLKTLPERLVVIGAGYIGLELGTAFAKLGSQVTVVEARAGILPSYDRTLAEPVRRWFERKGVTVHVEARVLGFGRGGIGVEIETKVGANLSIPAELVLVTVGRRPATEGWGLEEMNVAMDAPFVRVDERCATSTRNVWAIGDLVGEPMLAHKASAQGEMVAEVIAGRRRCFDPVAIPAVCFTEPEIVSVGMATVEAGTTASVFPLQANGRALSMEGGEDGGFVRIIARDVDHRILGVQAVGRYVSELAGEFAHSLEMGAVLEDVAGTIHAHPTLGEAFHEAALRGLGHAIHI